jgi:hypothetical protein
MGTVESKYIFIVTSTAHADRELQYSYIEIQSRSVNVIPQCVFITKLIMNNGQRLD